MTTTEPNNLRPPPSGTGSTARSTPAPLLASATSPTPRPARSPARSSSPTPPTSRPRSRRPRRPPSSGPVRRSARARRWSSASASCSTSARTSWPRSSPPSTARCTPTPWARCPAARRSSSSRAASRTCSRASNSPQVSTGVDVKSLRQPLGVVGIISPFNFPAMVPMWFFPIAIAAGNAVVLKPSEKDPSAALWMARLWQEAGLPDGVFTVLQGDKVAVDGLLDHPDVASISFVGSTPIAEYVYERASQAGKRVQALGGAKNHMVVLPDADLDLAADAAVSAGYGSAGERCMAISVRRRGRRHRRRPGREDRRAHRHPQDRRRHRARVTWAPGDARSTATRWRRTSMPAQAEGATLVVDGRDRRGRRRRGTASGSAPPSSTTCTPSMSVYTDEIFGPVLSVVRADTYEEALDLVNANRYGNGTAIFTSNGGAARAFEQDVEVGMIGVNVPIPVPMAYYSFGGWKSLALRRHPRPRRRGRALLHPRQGRHHPLARPLHRRRPRARLPQEPLRAGADMSTAYELDRKHVFHSWSAQQEITPMVITAARGSYVWDDEDRRYLDFSSQLVFTNIGHQHPRVIAAIKEQADRLCTVAPQFANEQRSEAAQLIAEIAPDGFEKVFFTNGGADANEHAVRMARLHTGRHKVMSTYRSLPRRHPDRDQPDRRPAPLGQRHRDRRRRALLRPVPLPLGVPRHDGRGGVRAGPGPPGAARSRSRVRRPSPRSCSRRSPARPASSSRRRATSPASASCATGTGSC